MISYSMMLIMIDGKVCNAGTNTVSTKRFYVWFDFKRFQLLGKKGQLIRKL